MFEDNCTDEYTERISTTTFLDLDGFQSAQQICTQYLLPELSDGRSEVSGIHSSPECLVLAESILNAIFCVPFVVAACPGELRLKALEQVVQAPGQNHNVVDVQQRNDHDGRVADTCTKTEMAKLS